MQSSMYNSAMENIFSKLNLLGLVINLLIPAIFLFAGYFLSMQYGGGFSLDGKSLLTLRWAFFIVSVVEVGIAFLIKRRMFASLPKFLSEGEDIKARVSILVKILAVIHTIVASSALYGLVYYLLGGDLDTFIILIIINLFGYQICRARKGDFDRLQDALYGKG